MIENFYDLLAGGILIVAIIVPAMIGGKGKSSFSQTDDDDAAFDDQHMNQMDQLSLVYSDPMDIFDD